MDAPQFDAKTLRDRTKLLCAATRRMIEVSRHGCANSRKAILYGRCAVLESRELLRRIEGKGFTWANPPL